MELTDEERKLIGFALACYLDDAEKRLVKDEKRVGLGFSKEARKQLHQIEEITYTKLIPESWCGPKPAYWSR